MGWSALPTQWLHKVMWKDHSSLTQRKTTAFAPEFCEDCQAFDAHSITDCLSLLCDPPSSLLPPPSPFAGTEPRNHLSQVFQLSIFLQETHSSSPIQSSLISVQRNVSGSTIRAGGTDSEAAWPHSVLFQQRKSQLRPQGSHSPRGQNTQDRKISRHCKEEIEIAYIHVQNLSVVSNQKQIKGHAPPLFTCQVDKNMEEYIQ